MNYILLFILTLGNKVIVSVVLKPLNLKQPFFFFLNNSIDVLFVILYFLKFFIGV